MIERLITVLKNKTVRDRLIFTLGILLVFKIGTTITIPRVQLLESGALNQGSYFELMNMLGGGGIENFSILALGVSPYLTSSIVISLLSMESVLPGLADLQKKGESGRKKLENATRYLTLIIAAVQAYTILLNAQSQEIISGSISTFDYFYITVVLIGGTFFTIWLADQISAKGVGNGVSMIIFAGIVGSMPLQFTGAFSSFVNKNAVAGEILSGSLKYAIYILAYLLVIVFVVFMEKAQRKLPVQYSNSSGQQREITFLPMKINSAGVMPVIFASTILMAPQTIASFLMNGATPKIGSVEEALIQITTIGQTYRGFHWATTIYLFLVFIFTFIYSNMQVNPERISENFQKSGGYIPGIRPGNETTRYITKVLNRVTLIGAIFLVIIAAMPVAIPLIFNISSSYAMGGTGLIIVVGVAIETSEQINGYVTGNKYQGFMDY